MVGEASKHKFAVTGTRSFVETETVLVADSILVTCDDCGQDFPEDQINYYEDESADDGEWLALCEKCSAA